MRLIYFSNPASKPTCSVRPATFRYFLTVRGFAVLVWSVALYLSVVNTLGVDELENQILQKRDRVLSFEAPATSHKTSRRIGKRNPNRSVAPSPTLVPSPPHSPAESHTISEPGPPRATCDALRQALLHPYRNAILGSAGKPDPYAQAFDQPPSILLLSSGWSLPPASTSKATDGGTDWAVLVHAVEKNLQNPSIIAQHVFVPRSECAEQVADEAVAINKKAVTAAAGDRSSTNRRGGKVRKSKRTKSKGEFASSQEKGRLAANGTEPAGRAPSFPSVRAPRLWLQVASTPPTWSALVRHGVEHAMTDLTGKAKTARLVLIARADLVWPKTFHCLSPAAMQSSGIILTFSCQINMPSCVEPQFALGGADWATAYRSCRAKKQTVAGCARMLDTCHKYAGVQHAIAFASPLSSIVKNAVGALSILSALYGTESRAVEALYNRLGKSRIANACLSLSPMCLRCAEFSELQTAAFKGAQNRMQPENVPREVRTTDACFDVDTPLASETNTVGAPMNASQDFLAARQAIVGISIPPGDVRRASMSNPRSGSHRGKF